MPRPAFLSIILIMLEDLALLLFPKYSRQIISTLATVELKMFSHELKEKTHKLNVRLGQVNCPEKMYGTQINSY